MELPKLHRYVYIVDALLYVFFGAPFFILFFYDNLCKCNGCIIVQLLI